MIKGTFKSSLKLTKAGYIFTGITIFIGVSAVNTGNNFLYFLVSLLLSFMWLSGLFARLNLKGITLVIYPPKEAYAKRKAFLRVRIKKNFFCGFLYRITIMLKGKISSEKLFLKVPFLFGEKEISLAFTCEHRGIYKIETITISSFFPLGLFERKRFFEEKVEFILFPEPKGCNYYEKDIREAKKGGKEGLVLGAEEFDSISDYIAGIPRKFIHWKAFAKWDELKRKIYLEGEIPGKIIDLFQLPHPSLEEKLSCATYLIIKAISKGEAVGLKIGHLKYGPQKGEAHKIKLLTRLALYEARSELH
ncbi:MAG: DUF58 domain-containing protein [Caldimicrobium sp.]